MASEKDNETIMDVMNRMVREEKKERGRLGVGVSSGVSQPLVLTPEKKRMAREAILKGARQKKVSHTIAGRINEFVPKSKNKGGKRDLRYDLPRELRSSFNTIVKANISSRGYL